MLPKVSVIVSCYNYEQYVAKAIHSVLAQTYQHIDCVVIDDCSTDGSFRVIEEVLDKANRSEFRAIRLGRNVGQMHAFRAGLENTDGAFVVFLDADDVLESTFVETHVAVHLNRTRPAAMTASDTITIDREDRVLEGTYIAFGGVSQIERPLMDIPSSSIPKIDGEKLHFSKEGRKLKVKYREPVRKGWPFCGTSSFMFRRDVMKLIVWPETDSIRICADFYLVQLSCAMGGALMIYEMLGCYRVHDRNNFVGSAVTGGARKARVGATNEILDSINRKADEIVGQRWYALGAVLEDSFLVFFPNASLKYYAGSSRLKRALERIWDRLPQRVQSTIMPFADFVDRWVK